VSEQRGDDDALGDRRDDRARAAAVGAEVTKYSASVDWSSLSKSVQSSATTMLVRPATTKGTHARNNCSSTTPPLLSSLSTCLTACLGSKPAAIANPTPIA
jgi:hypothetical protein